jgi:hypothetical protein
VELRSRRCSLVLVPEGARGMATLKESKFCPSFVQRLFAGRAVAYNRPMHELDFGGRSFSFCFCFRSCIPRCWGGVLMVLQFRRG